jgi:hypothetical protein
VRGPTRRIRIDDTYLPVLVMELDEDHAADVPWMLEQFERNFSLGKRYAMACDALKVTRPLDANGRRDIGKWLLANRKHLERYCVGSGIAFPSALVRGAMTALYWITPSPMPMYYPATFEQAARWCVEKLEAAGEPISIKTRSVILHAQAASAPRGG